MFKRSIAAAAVALATSALISPAFAQQTILSVRGAAPVTGPAVAEGAGERIDRAGVESLFSDVDAATRKALSDQPERANETIALHLVTQALLREAVGKGVQNRADVRARAERAAQAEIAQAYLEELTQPQLGAYPSEAEMKQVYDANPRAFLRPAEVQLAQFAVPVPPGSAAPVVEEARRRITDLRNRAAGSAESFAVVTLENNGSQLGWVPVAQLQNEVRSVIENAAVGAVTQPIRVENGFVVLRVQARRGGDAAPFNDVKEQLRAQLRGQRLNQLRQQAVAERLQRAPLDVKDAAALKAAIAGPAR